MVLQRNYARNYSLDIFIKDMAAKFFLRLNEFGELMYDHFGQGSILGLFIKFPKVKFW